MRQILQNLRTGDTKLEELPAPQVRSGEVLIRTRKSLISAGTERMLVEFSQGNLLQKAKSQPDKVKQVLDKIRTEGLAPTLEMVFKRLDEPLPLGYCNAGEVIEVGSGVTEFKVGDRVASNGAHAEIVAVPKNLCAKVPDNVSDEEAAFAVLGSIGLQGIRLAEPTLGERFAVIGAGLIGLVTIQLLRASGCEVLAVDPDASRLKLAESYGAIPAQTGSADPIAAAKAMTDGVGVDGVIITASAKTDEIIHQSAQMCRKRGRVILVGVVGLNIRRSDFYEKEIRFQVSSSYGPGRYDEKYEQRGWDYPYGFVRWTEQRNIQAVLDALATDRLDVSALITDRISFDKAQEAYDKITGAAGTLGVVLEYGEETPDVAADRFKQIGESVASKSETACVAAMIGAGNFAKMTMAPALTKTGARLKYVADLYNPQAAKHIARKYRFEIATTDNDAAWNDPEVNTLFLATRHDFHSALTCRGLEAGKHVFVEKPLALNVEELAKIVKAHEAAPDRQVMVGFNRRFSPHIVKIKKLLASRSEPLAMNYTCNAGIIPPEVWVHDPEVGGGRIIGEACHFMDLLAYITGSPIRTVSAVQFGRGVAVKEDKMSIVLGFEDGSIGTVNYFANGSNSYPKEEIEVFSEGRVLRVNNYRETRGYGFGGFHRLKTKRMDKGHGSQFGLFTDRITEGGEPLVPFDQLVNVTLASFAAVESARSETAQPIDAWMEKLQKSVG